MATTQQRVTNKELRRIQLLETDEAARALTGYTEQELADFKYETGLDYLYASVKDRAARRYLEGSRAYWNWWKNQWEMRDAEEIPFLCEESFDYQYRGGRVYREATREGYRLIHRVARLTDVQEPESMTLLRSFNVLVGSLTERTSRTKEAA